MEDDIEKNFLSELAVLCSERLGQMTKPYDDLEAVTQLLEEKEKDLELAAKIGKSLLERNKELQQTNEYLEEQVNYATDQVTQLKHELQQKIDLLHIYTDNESADSGGSTPASERFSNWSLLQRKIRILEEENVSLKLETNHLKTLTQGLEEKEQQLLNDCMKQIADCNGQITTMNVEFLEKQEMCEMQLKQISRLQKEMAERSSSEKLLRCENEDLTLRLRATQETQAELAQELLDLQERYAEVVAMLTESKEELKQLREKAMSSRLCNGSMADDSLYDSLASELEASDSGYSTTCGGRDRHYESRMSSKNEALRRRSHEHLIKVMETVRNSLQKQEQEREKQQAALEKDVPLDPAGTILSPGSMTSAENVHKAKNIVEEIETTLSPMKEESRVSSSESLCSYPAPGVGVPGIPGTKDLEFAIRRLSLRRRVELEFARYRGEKGVGPSLTLPARSFLIPTARGHSIIQHTKTDLFGNATLPKHPSSPVPFRARLLLVKPVEGSETMAHWKKLATPGGIDPSSWAKRPGIKVRGGNGESPPIANQSHYCIPPLSVHIPSLHSEADTSRSLCRQFSPTPGTFSFVDSQILHPAESRATTTVSYSTSPALSVTASLPRDDGTSTFSTGVNLAQVLGERCVSLVTGISGGRWPSRRSPMTIPVWTSPPVHSEARPCCDVSGLESLVEECASNDGLSPKRPADQESGEKASKPKGQERRPANIGGVVMRTNLKPSK